MSSKARRVLRLPVRLVPRPLWPKAGYGEAGIPGIPWAFLVPDS
jgi:hypothetical protein